MKKNLLFCNLKHDLDICRKEPHSYHLPYGLGIIMEIAQKNHLPFDFYDTYAGGSTKDFISHYQRNQHDIILVSSIVGNYAYDYYDLVFSQIKAINPRALIIMGGPITNIFPRILMEELPVDVIVIGEGEVTFNELIEVDFNPDRFASIDGIGYRNSKGDICLTAPRQPLKSPLENQSYNPRFNHPSAKVLLNKYVEHQISLDRGWDLSASRGCFGDCTFCKKVFDKPLRFFSPEYIVTFLENIQSTYGINRFNFMDENFIVNRKIFSRFLDLLEERNLNVRWRLRARIDSIPYHMIDRMEKLGLYSLMVGVESANQGVLDYYHKQLVIDHYLDGLAYIAEKDLLFTSFILGAPIESRDTINDNIRFIKRMKLKRKNLAIGYLSVIPGTRIFNECLQTGKIESTRDYLKNYVGDFTRIELNISNMTDQELLEGRQAMTAACVD